MKIYVGQVAANEVDEFGEEGLIGPDSNGYFYGQYVEIGTNAGGMDEVAIGDGCGRMVPITIESLPDLIAALQDIQDSLNTIAEAKKLRKQLKSEAVKYVEDQETYFDYDESPENIGW